MQYLMTVLLTAWVCLHPVLKPLHAQDAAGGRPPKGCWTKSLVWTLARQDLPVADPTRWIIIAELPWSSWRSGTPMQTVRGDQLLLTVTTLDNWQISLASGPRDEPVTLIRVSGFCTFIHEEPDLRIVFSTRTFR